MATVKPGTMHATGMGWTGAQGAGTTASAAVTISATAFDEIRRAAFSSDVLQSKSRADEEYAALKAARREASHARSSKWPNTLTAQRAKKTQTRQDERDGKEDAQLELDAIEENLRLQERLAVIRKANEYYSTQSDRMKALENYRQRSYDVEVEKAQGALKAERRVLEAAREAGRVKELYADVAAAAGEEEARREAARAKAAQITKDQKAQLHAVIARKMEELRAREVEGRAMVESTAALERESSAAAVKRQAEAAAKSKAFAAENARLLSAREALKSSESELVAWIEGQARAKEEQEARIKVIIERQREEAAVKARIISEIMEKDYTQRAGKEEERVAKDAAAAEAREEAEAAAKKVRQAEMRDSILGHIRAMKDKTIASILKTREEEARDHAVFTAKLAALESQEREDGEAKRLRAKQYQLVHRAQAADKKRVVEGAVANIRAEAQAADEMAKGGPQDEAFFREVERLRVEEQAKGHDTKPLDRLVHKLLNPPIMPNLQRM